MPARAHDAGGGARASRAHSRVLRIIAGRHRGRRLRFPAGVEIRPTPDRVRETLFNWLQPRIDQSRVLDLFAGSGALGLEALSRGAAQVTFVEKDRRAAAAIEAVAREWQEANARVVCESAIAWLASSRPANRRSTSCSSIRPTIRICWPRRPRRLAAGSRPTRASISKGVPGSRCQRCRTSWKELRAGRAGEVGYHLFSV